jgi:hypothetical protein
VGGDEAAEAIATVGTLLDSADKLLPHLGLFASRLMSANVKTLSGYRRRRLHVESGRD